jgi:Cof subfamily protein (haloacid dehalogenase superfamily)
VKPRLLAMDLDGTLVGPDLIISARNRAAIREARDRGVFVTLATGRMLRSTLPFARRLSLETPVICYQGAMVAEPVTGEVLLHRTVPLALAREVVELAEERAWHIHYYVDDVMYVDEMRPQVAEYTSIVTDAMPRAVGNLCAFLDRLPNGSEPTKLLIIGDQAATTATLSELRERFSTRLYITRSLPTFAEVANRECSKGAALAWLAGRLGVAQADTVAIGDGLNDLEMVLWAGTGAAVGNAVPELKAAADYQASTVDRDAVAEVIERFLL